MDKYEQSLKIAEALGDQVGVARSNGQIGQLLTQVGRYAEAFMHLLFALNTFKKLESPNAEIAANNLKALRILWGEKEFDAAWHKATGEEVPDWLK
ncbi:MAG: tetratricopeptide repeat protein [Candidatus Competibacteraceae bacterium]